MAHPESKGTSGLKRTFTTGTLVLLALGLIAYGGWGFWQRYRATHNSHPAIPAAVITHSTDTPDETPLADTCTTYKVADDQPRSIALPSIDASGCIQKVGIDQHGAVGVPSNIYLAAWYVRSALPGQTGVSVIDGHVSGRYSRDAIFAKLGSLRPGNQVKVQLGNGAWLTFAVVSVDHYAVDQAMQELFKPLDGVSKQLNLITCDGAFDRQTQSYDQRVIVRTKLI